MLLFCKGWTMKTLQLSLAAFMIASSAVASAQPKIPSESDRSVKPPADSGMVKSPDSAMKGPSDSGMVVVPPKVDSKSVKTPPKNIDPEIDDATKDIDRENRKKSDDKQKSQ
jgi:hypothetical protein